MRRPKSEKKEKPTRPKKLDTVGTSPPPLNYYWDILPARSIKTLGALAATNAMFKLVVESSPDHQRILQWLLNLFVIYVVLVRDNDNTLEPGAVGNKGKESSKSAAATVGHHRRVSTGVESLPSPNGKDVEGQKGMSYL